MKVWVLHYFTSSAIHQYALEIVFKENFADCSIHSKYGDILLYLPKNQMLKYDVNIYKTSEKFTYIPSLSSVCFAE